MATAITPRYETWPKTGLADEAARLADLTLHLEAEIKSRIVPASQSDRPYRYFSHIELQQDRRRLAKARQALEVAS